MMDHGRLEQHHAGLDPGIVQPDHEFDGLGEAPRQLLDLGQAVHGRGPVLAPQILFQYTPQGAGLGGGGRLHLCPRLLGLLQGAFPTLALRQRGGQIDSAGQVAAYSLRTEAEQGIEIVLGRCPVIDIGDGLVQQRLQALLPVVRTNGPESIQHGLAAQASLVQHAPVGDAGVADHAAGMLRMRGGGQHAPPVVLVLDHHRQIPKAGAVIAQKTAGVEESRHIGVCAECIPPVGICLGIGAYPYHDRSTNRATPKPVPPRSLPL